MKYPSFPFYPNDWLSAPEIMIMTPAEEGAYIRLLCLCWASDGLPDNDDQLSVLSRLGKAWIKSKDLIISCFIRVDGRLQHKRLLEEKKKYEQFRDKQRTNGQRGGRPKKSVNERFSEDEKKGLGFSGLSQNDPKKSFSLSPSLSPLKEDIGGANTPPAQPQSGGNAKTKKPKKQFIQPSETEVTLYFADLMTGNWTPERIKLQSAKWYNHYIGNGWKVGKNPMKDWRATVRNWTLNDFDQNNQITANAATTTDSSKWERNKKRTLDLEDQ